MQDFGGDRTQDEAAKRPVPVGGHEDQARPLYAQSRTMHRAGSPSTTRRSTLGGPVEFGQRRKLIELLPWLAGRDCRRDSLHHIPADIRYSPNSRCSGGKNVQQDDSGLELSG